MSSQFTIDRMLSSILEGLSDPAILVEPDRHIVASNRAFRSRFNGGNDPRGLSCFEITHGRESPCPYEEVGRCPLESRENERVLHKHVRCLGEAYEEVFVHPVENPSGEIAAHLIVSHPLNCTVQLVGRSRVFGRMVNAIRDAATGDAPVLLWGETGAGKMCVARTLHEMSARAGKPFAALSCAATSEPALAERLFGCEARAASSARRQGMIESAAGGTLLLRDAGELPTRLARRVLAAVRRRTFRPEGGAVEMRADVRWVLSGERRGDFGWVSALMDVRWIEVPALRHRRGDLEDLVQHMISRFGEGRIREISREALQLLADYPFPGNIRQLEGMIERACMLADGRILLPVHFPDLLGTAH
jgi:transcriptional regulator with PAS, ATPase and Fis domain